MKPNAIYGCWHCGAEFESEFNKQLNRYDHPSSCPNCMSKYFTWFNYQELFENGARRLG